MNHSPLTQKFYTSIARRMGKEIASRRLNIQVDHAATLYGKGCGHIHLENSDRFTNFVDTVLQITGMREQGRRNSLDFSTEKNSVYVQDLPPGLKGLRILHLTDIHIDGFSDGGTALFSIIDSLQYDLCVFTGDYRMHTHNSYKAAATGMSQLITHINCPLGIYAVLGNHDFIEQVPFLEESGARVLLNEGAVISHNGGEIFIAGIDDPHFYGTHDIERAFSGRNKIMPTILLAHSPEVYTEAEKSDVDLYLCGHTHGGQICLPGGIPIITHAACPRHLTRGSWQYGSMNGYTSRGAGCSGVQARFNCPPEITIHTLHNADNRSRT